ncbi:MAG TPA: aminotransferase class I/II-fold pyridoxal phosphate-dependent enzyme [Candidatus Dorea faecigallinarum]|nr:aminotransferase class I/II-fold pyridoxal phosphate-dependent enzyme [Candidatus Dorea faecigallinarum]
MQTLLEKLTAYGASDHYGFHMPGHKRQLDLMEGISPYQIDITEIDGFDDLHHAEGILKEAQEQAAKVYHAEETHFLVNGSTAGILSAILGSTRRGDQILVARNCHKSVYHAIEMQELKPVYLYPGFDPEAQLNTEISAEDVRAALKRHPGVRAVVIVSPTYDGIVSDVESIAEAVHVHDIPLIVDEAHGAHFGFHPYFPENANQKGADLVIHSLHKTLPALTQTALLHMNGERADRRRVRKYLHMLQTSSPSYVLMASVDACIHLLREEPEQVFEPYVRCLKETREKLCGLKNLRLAKVEGMDPSKLVISVKDAGISSREFYDRLLQDWHLQPEMRAGTYVLLMTTLGDTPEGMERLVRALCAIDAEAEGAKGEVPKLEEAGLSTEMQPGKFPRQEQVFSPAEAEALQGSEPEHIASVRWEESPGEISLEYAYLYPPGCPVIVPGEKVSQEAAVMLQWYQAQGFSVEGLREDSRVEVYRHG